MDIAARGALTPSGPTERTLRSVSKTIHRVYKYRLYPSLAQEQELERQLELCRRLYNKALWWREGAYKRSGDSVTHKQQIHALTDLRRCDPEYASIVSGVLENVLKRVDNAFKAFFRRCKAGEKPGYPRSKGIGWYKSLTVPRNRELRLKHEPGNKFGHLSFKGLSNIRVRMHRDLPNDVKVRRVIVKREANGHWYACFGWDKEAIGPEAADGDAVGVDLGLNSYLATSNGDTLESPKYLRKSERRIRRAQRSISRKRRGSNRREKAKNGVAKLHAKVRNQRKDFLHNTSRRLVDEHTTIAVEKLNVRGMVKNRHLAKSISDAGWAEFTNMLSYKAESAGKSVVLVDPKGTSQACSECGAIVKKTLATRTHRCECGLVLDRDVNAAKNILKLGLCKPCGA